MSILKATIVAGNATTIVELVAIVPYRPEDQPVRHRYSGQTYRLTRQSKTDDQDPNARPTHPRSTLPIAANGHTTAPHRRRHPTDKSRLGPWTMDAGTARGGIPGDSLCRAKTALCTACPPESHRAPAIAHRPSRHH